MPRRHHPLPQPSLPLPPAPVSEADLRDAWDSTRDLRLRVPFAKAITMKAIRIALENLARVRSLKGGH